MCSVISVCVVVIVVVCLGLIFFFKQKTAYEMRISDWSSDVCSSDLSSMTVPRAHSYSADGVRSRTAPAGSYVIDMSQPQGKVAKAILEADPVDRKSVV